MKTSKHLILKSIKFIPYFFNTMLIALIINSFLTKYSFLDSIISYLFWFSMGLYCGELIVKYAIKNLENINDVYTFLGIKKPR